MSNEHHEHTFIEAVDNDTRNNILRLDQKLKGLQAEISAKIDGMASLTDAASSERKKQLMILSDEVKKAIQGIQRLVNLAVADEFSASEFNEMNQEKIEALREMFKESADKISLIKEKF